jgi:hypothetical protein
MAIVTITASFSYREAIFDEKVTEAAAKQWLTDVLAKYDMKLTKIRVSIKDNSSRACASD